jgi:hypothetical protein
MAFSVTGKVFTTLRNVDNTATWNTTFGDTGFVLNFDGFDVKYVMKAPGGGLVLATGGTPGHMVVIGQTEEAVPMNVTNYVAAVVTTTTYKATSPGMVGIENIKLGDTVTAGVDVIWYTLGFTSADAYTNSGGVGTTNNVTVSYNSFELDPLLTIVISDVLKVNINDHQAIKFYGGTGTSVFATAGATNVVTGGGYLFNIPVIVDYTGVENLAIQAGIRIKTQSDSSVSTLSVDTNSATSGLFDFGMWGQVTYTVSDALKVTGKLALDIISSSGNGIAASGATVSTNLTNASSMPIGLSAGVIFMPASKVTLRLCGTINIPMSDVTTVISGNGAATNTQVAGMSLAKMDPMVEFGGGYDVTENFNVGITGKVYWAPIMTGTSYTAGNIGSSSTSGLMNFQNGSVDDPASIAVDLSYKF